MPGPRQQKRSDDEGSHAVEIERLKAAQEQAKLRSRQLKYQLWERVADGFRAGIWIVSSWVPLQVVTEIAHEVSGKDTNFNMSVRVTIELTLLVSVGWAISAAKSHGRKQKVKRLRDRLERLESQLVAKQDAKSEKGGVAK